MNPFVQLVTSFHADINNRYSYWWFLFFGVNVFFTDQIDKANVLNYAKLQANWLALIWLLCRTQTHCLNRVNTVDAHLHTNFWKFFVFATKFRFQKLNHAHNLALSVNGIFKLSFEFIIFVSQCGVIVFGIEFISIEEYSERK